MLRIARSAFYLVILAAAAAAQVPTINTFAGGGPSNVAAISAAIGQVDGIIGDAAGNWYFSGSDLGRVFKVDPAGNLTVLAGTGFNGPVGDGCLAANAALTFPTKLALDPVRNYLYINDSGALVVRRVDLATGLDHHGGGIL